MCARYSSHPTAIIESEDIGEGTRLWHFVHIREKACIGTGCNVGKGTYIDTLVEIGSNVKIGNFVSVFRGTRIEDDVLIGPSVTFTNDLRPRAFFWSEERIVPTIVRKGASIGANSTILCGIIIERYAMIGAGSVVTKDIPPFALAYGNPAVVRGLVCYCGNKLERMVEEDAERRLYECECGKTVEIERKWFE